MDTSGHTELSAIGEELLKPALKKSNSEKEMRIGAFYLGNWLTDVSQCIDPVAYKKGAVKIQKLDAAIEALFDRMRFDAPSWMPDYLINLAKPLKDLRDSLQSAEHQLVKDLRDTLNAGSDGSLAKAFKEAFRYIGYFKFVLDDEGAPTEMDPAVYFKLFDARFTQYFPHEHLDRPETKPDVYATKKSDAPLNRWSKSQGVFDLYEFLRVDIQLAAGLLSYLDAGNDKVKAHQSWAAGTFHKDRTKFVGRDGKPHDVADTDYEWNYHLAMLGHSLHAVEDFFAHSTFVEHACCVFPKDYKRFERFEESNVLARRLQAWFPGVDDYTGDLTKRARDSHVVTGYFDFSDTIISLTHLLDHWFDLPNEKVGRRVDKAIEYEYTKLFTDTLDLVSHFDNISRFSRIWNDPKNNPKTKGYNDKEGNLAVKILREKAGTGLEVLEGESKINKIVEVLLKSDQLKDLPPQVKDSFSNGVKLLGGVVVGVKIYKCLKSIHTFFKTPLAWLKKFVPPAVHDLLEELGQVYLKNLLLEYIGSQRIGCHSLIAKDTGPELFHEAAMECARATHWYVVHMITRHFYRPDHDAARSGQDGKSRNNILLSTHIDWLELLEYFLEHPFTQVQGPPVEEAISVSVTHVTRRDPSSIMSLDSLATLEKKYKKTFRPLPAGPQEFTWELIADFNFPTAGLSTKERRNAINRVLKHQELGVKVSDGVNYAFKPGLRLTIPYQKDQILVYEGGPRLRAWWYPVILGKDGYKSVVGWFDAIGGLSTKAPEWAHHPYPITKSAADTFYNDVLSKQNALRISYEGKALKELY